MRSTFIITGFCMVVTDFLTFRGQTDTITIVLRKFFHQKGLLMKLQKRVIVLGTLLIAIALVSLFFFGAWLLVSYAKQPEHQLSLTQFILIYLTGSLFVVVLLLFVNHWILKRITLRVLTPVEQLVESARCIQNGDYSFPISMPDQPDLIPIFTAFSDMQRQLLAEQQKKAEEERARASLIAGISHDLRTPLTAVKGYLKGLQDGVANTPEKQSRYLSIAYRRTCEMESLLHRLLFYSRLGSRNLSLNIQTVDLEDLVQTFFAERSDDWDPEQIQATVETDGGTFLSKLDSEQFTRILNNLTDNAIKYAPGHPLLLHIHLSCLSDGLHLIFSDSGPGVPSEALPHLFEEFWRADPSRSTRHAEGNGLGLFIVRYLTEAMHGTITARNDHGLTLELIFPPSPNRIL